MKQAAAFAATLATVAAVAAVTAVAALAVAVTACKDDTPKDPIHIGFVPPPELDTPPAPLPSTSAEPAAPAFTSYFDTLDSGPKRTTSAAVAAQPAQNRPDPDVAAQEALRSRLNTCFPLANVAKGTSRDVAVTFTVIATGRVTRYDISGASSADGAFYDCVHGIADSASFAERSTTAVPGGPPPVSEVRTVVVTAGATAS